MWAITGFSSSISNEQTTRLISPPSQRERKNRHVTVVDKAIYQKKRIYRKYFFGIDQTLFKWSIDKQI